MHPYFHLFSLSIPAYWLFALFGALAAGAYCFAVNRRGAREHVSGLHLLYIGLYSLIGAMLGGRLLYRIVSLAAGQPAQGLLSQGGMVYYGGLLGALLAVALYCGHRKGLSFRTVVGICTPAIALFHAFGRIGCFFAGCCWGVACEGGLTFTQSIAAPNGVPLFPVQLLEAGCNALLFLFLHKAAGRLRENWLLLPLYLCCYGTVRFLVEFLRGDPSRGIWLLSTSQWISLAAIIAGGLCLLQSAGCSRTAKRNTNC